MGDRIRKALQGILLLFLIVILAASGLKIKAEAGFGDFNDYDSGSDWDSDYDSDWGSDYDSDWDWDDDDYGYSNNRSSNVSSMGESVFVTVLVFVLIAYTILHNKNDRTGSSQGSQTRKNAPVKTQQKTLPDRTSEISAIIRKEDPNFTAPDFISFVKQVYVDIQDAWAKRDLEPVRAVLHQNLYQQTQRQIQKKIEDGIVNHLERISVNTAYLTSYRRDAEYEYLGVYLAASMIDYQVKEATGEVILGDKTTRWNMYYKMIFMRSAGSKTRSAKEKEEGFVCPNCGAPIKGTSFGVCEYCGSTVTTGMYDWVLSDFGVVKNDTVDEGIMTNSQ